MAGFPQLREAGWLQSDDPYLPLALVRLFERMDGSGVWEVWLSVNNPREEEGEVPLKVVPHPNEQSARAELARLYSTGEWRKRQPDAY